MFIFGCKTIVLEEELVSKNGIEVMKGGENDG